MPRKTSEEIPHRSPFVQMAVENRCPDCQAADMRLVTKKAGGGNPTFYVCGSCPYIGHAGRGVVTVVEPDEALITAAKLSDL